MSRPDYVSTTNACKLCTPLGAALAFRGIEQAVPLLHGSQGCATYMRRYIISHFREPMDIASSSLGEKSAVFGGGPNLKQALLNVGQRYGARLVGVATTCLTETIGDDVPALIREFKKEFGARGLPELVTVSTPSFRGTHLDGWRAAIKAVVETMAGQGVGVGGPDLNLLPGLFSPADIRELKKLTRAFGLKTVVLPDISLTLDGPARLDYERIPSGGAPLADIRAMGGAGLTVEFGSTFSPASSAGRVLAEKFNRRALCLPYPIGIRNSDAFLRVLADFSGKEVPADLDLVRGRLVDAMVDGHKYLAGAKAAVYGEEDLVVGLVSFLSEIGVQVVLAGSGDKTGRLKTAAAEAVGDLAPEPPLVLDGVDFYQIADQAARLRPDILIGNGKGAPTARELGVPLVRVGFPIHDRFGAQRVLTVGHEGALALLDRIVNALLEHKQAASAVGWGYM
ncbi:MAG: nitrogenase component 1 [Pseudomonadota bacterium]